MAPYQPPRYKAAKYPGIESRATVPNSFITAPTALKAISMATEVRVLTFLNDFTLLLSYYPS